MAPRRQRKVDPMEKRGCKLHRTIRCNFHRTLAGRICPELAKSMLIPNRLQYFICIDIWKSDREAEVVSSISLDLLPAHIVIHYTDQDFSRLLELPLLQHLETAV